MSTIKERPILFSTPMVQANQAGLKKMTRRMTGLDRFNEEPNAWEVQWVPDEEGKHWLFEYMPSGQTLQIKCPYGVEDDRLWVRETWRKYYPVDPNGYTDFQNLVIEFAADNPEMVPLLDGDGLQEYNKNGTEKYIPWKPSIHMPRVVSRTLLEIVKVRLERLLDITVSDIADEGIDLSDIQESGWAFASIAEERWQALWEKINGSESYEANPWVWVVEFKKVSA